jgi:hypothetical protein
LKGVISRADDVDTFKFTTNGGNVNFEGIGSGNGSKLDVMLELRDSAGQLIASANPPETLTASITADLPAGTYTLSISGVGHGNPTDSNPVGYTDFGSVGQYSIECTTP